MLEQEMNNYRKWVGICALTTVRPLVLTHQQNFDELCPTIIIKHEDKVLLKITADEFEELSAREILTKAGITANDHD